MPGEGLTLRFTLGGPLQNGAAINERDLPSPEFWLWRAACAVCTIIGQCASRSPVGREPMVESEA